VLRRSASREDQDCRAGEKGEDQQTFQVSGSYLSLRRLYRER
jgi:hypothetical protein